MSAISWLASWLMGNWKTPAFLIAAAAVAWFAHMTDKAIGESQAYDRGVKDCNQKRDAARTAEIVAAQKLLNEQIELRREVDRETQALAEKSRAAVAVDNDSVVRRLRESIAGRSVRSAGVGDGAQAGPSKGPDGTQGGGSDANARAPDPGDQVERLQRHIDALLDAYSDTREAALNCANEAGIIGSQLDKIERGP